MRQMSIFDLMDPKKETPEEHKVTNYSEWLRLPEGAEIKRWSVIEDYSNEGAEEGELAPDRTAEGHVNGEPALIGYVIGVSGPGECFTHDIPKYYKPMHISFMEKEEK